MPAPFPKRIRCLNPECRHKFTILMGDCLPTKVICPKCGLSFPYFGKDIKLK